MNVIEPQAANPSKLPLWDTICLSYSTYFNNFLDVLRISWLWMLVGVPLLGYASWQQMSWMAKSIDLKPGIPPPPVPTQTLQLGLAHAGQAPYLA